MWFKNGVLGVLIFLYSWASIAEEYDARLETINHIKQNGGVAVLVSIGTKDTLTGEQIGEAISAKFESLYEVPTAYFVRQSTADYGFLEFYMWEAATGPHGADEWDTPEEAKAMFHDIYITYLAAISLGLN